VLRAGFGIFSDLLLGSIADVVGVNPPYVKAFQGGLLGTAGGAAIAPGVLRLLRFGLGTIVTKRVCRDLPFLLPLGANPSMKHRE
jgi:hypothetical protein